MLVWTPQLGTVTFWGLQKPQISPAMKATDHVSRVDSLGFCFPTSPKQGSFHAERRLCPADMPHNAGGGADVIVGAEELSHMIING